jgi:transcriptional regulator with XRE-family HTH domain
MSIPERINQILKDQGITPSVFADRIGVQRSNVSHVLSGRSKPGLDFLEKILNHFPELDAHWLITGNEGGAIVNQRIESINNHDKPLSESKEVTKIIEFYSDGTFTEYRPTTR